MDTNTTYVIMAFGIGEDKEIFPMTCTVAKSTISAISFFNSVVDQIRGDKPLVNCMSKYTRNSDRVTREMQLYGEVEGKDVLFIASIIKAVDVCENKL